MRRIPVCAWLAVVLSLWAIGCGGAVSVGRPPRGGPEFPSQASLAALAQQPVQASATETRKTVSVDDWQPAADPSPSTEAEGLAQRVAGDAGRPVVIEPELSCAAREIARFYLQHGAFPDQQLQALMAGVCGSTQAAFQFTLWAESSAAVVAHQQEWRDAIAKQLGGWLPAATKQVGAAEVSDGAKSVFVVTLGQSEIDWESRSPVVNESDEVVLSGSLRAPAAFIFGLANVGANGQRECVSDPRVAPPRFRVTCQLDPADTAAWIDIEALAPGRVLARGVARVLMRREGTPLSFSAPTKRSPPESVSDNARFAQRLLQLVNERRAQARLSPLELAPRQSETSTRLAVHYFAPDIGGDRSDLIALGVMAGWEVQGTIRTGNFYSNQLTGSLDPRRWLSFVLDQPSARRVLLDPQASSIAIGPDVQTGPRSIGALVSTYQFYTSDDHRDDVWRFVGLLNERRRGLGLPPAKVVPNPEVSKAVQSVKTSHDPNAALQEALQQVVSRSQQGAEGYVIEATDLDHVTMPEALLRPQVTIAISAAHHRYPQSAWGTLTLLVIVTDSGVRQQTAQQHQGAGATN